MKKLEFWRFDWFLGVVVAVLVLALSGRDLIQSLERKAYDLGMQVASRAPSDKVAVIAIDDQSIANIGATAAGVDTTSVTPVSPGMLSLAIGVTLIVAHFVLMVTQLMWLQLMAAVINKSLAKTVEGRYQDGEQMAKALKLLCLQSLSAAPATSS